MQLRNSRRTRAEWAVILDDHEDSGLSVKDYCRQHQLGFSTFNKWRLRFRTESVGANPTVTKPAFVAVKATIPEAQSASSIVLQIGSSITLRITTSETNHGL